ncbi:hypothetical protein J1N35_039313 [Gossypium stocksii]|uniref:Uncharacterized protein n=1 Tax=Gossypium stocksii TaxID=47602 RepID=A0A9D3ZNE1_9ROSI|nr:hypothetical protein J1N35_039313 [Gossypium stocksii]
MTCCNNSATAEFKIRCGISTIAFPSCGHNICSQDEGIHDYLPGLPSGVKFDPRQSQTLQSIPFRGKGSI